MPPLTFTEPSALVLIDNQFAFNHPTHWGPSRSNPSFEKNLSALLKVFRAARQRKPAVPIYIIHIFHSSLEPGSQLHHSKTDQIKPLDFAVPASDGSEPVFWKSANSSFIGTGLESFLREHGVRQVFFADGSLPEGIRIERGRVVLVADATATFAKGEFDAETVHAVSVASLSEEFADVFTTEAVVEALGV
ncbi:isochorismatase family hydrolase, putative [Talaromyces stipitatus ATCC 10500]|uniref:Isochorismatase family hydrolase, putative n=1 Tax=Talaromyces stipitatus (strain ATCC 10500 / CBS 375.48 / QM 6759 / NRRL 1006) TaxID=441959 RepID=B8MNP0_TALSN|nr:isochorismatase family hydrolase, putative [Talaromyces stipitatus ATCC 10500]EED14129.1 isochorismatase family hydrolase, putative [Talaromyces stipitatus ATCC 10500]